jgi:hypothetical protein
MPPTVRNAALGATGAPLGCACEEGRRPRTHRRHTPAVARRRRGILAIVAATAVLGCLSATAQASQTLNFKVAFSPDRLGAYTTVVSNVAIGTATGEVPSPVVRLELHFPESLNLTSSNLGLDICNPTTLLAEGREGCPTNSLMGLGSATAVVPFGPELVSENATISVFMGPSAEQTKTHVEEQVTTVLLYGEGSTPVYGQILMLGGLGGSGPFNELQLNSDIPLVPTLPGARDASITNMQLSLGPRHIVYYVHAHHRLVAFHPRGIQLPERCPKGGFPFYLKMTFQDGTTATASPVVPCPHSRHRR